jgi:hypothetical protein
MRYGVIADMTKRRCTLLITVALSFLSVVLPQNIPSINDLLSANLTRIMEATKMSVGVLVAIIIVLIGILVYLWIDAGKESKLDELIREVKLLNRRLHKVEKRMGRQGQTGKTVN